MVAWIIDRRQNPEGKSLVNSQRFMNRAKEQIRKSIDETVKKGKVQNLGSDGVGTITVPSSSLAEPSFRFDEKNSIKKIILPGNKDHSDRVSSYIEKDRIAKPPSGGRGRQGGSPDGEGEDDFSFKVSDEEWANLLFADMELPNLEQQTLSDAVTTAWSKAGYKTSGSPANISIKKTLTNSFGRRRALNRPKTEETNALEEEFFDPDTTEERKEVIRLELDRIQNKLKMIPYIDTMDVRYYNLKQEPKPIFKAVMFCLMDVSGSMTEEMKDIAKRFYILLYRFLKMKYEKVDVVFVRHTHQASIVTEEEFFYSRETGGTVVSTGFEVIDKKIKDYYSPETWNIYIAQSGDGDNTHNDDAKVIDLLEKNILPVVKYTCYLEVGEKHNYFYSSAPTDSTLWKTYEENIVGKYPNFIMKKAKDRKEIYPVFAEIFRKKD